MSRLSIVPLQCSLAPRCSPCISPFSFKCLSTCFKRRDVNHLYMVLRQVIYRFWNQRSLPFCKPEGQLLITRRYRLKRLSNTLMNTVHLFPPEVDNSVWAWRAPIPFLRDHTVRLLCTQLKNLIRRFRNPFIYCASNFLKPLGWSVSSPFRLS